MVKEKIELIYMRKSTKMRLEIKNENLFIYMYLKLTRMGHAALMFGIPFIFMRISVAELKSDLTREFNYLIR